MLAPVGMIFSSPRRTIRQLVVGDQPAEAILDPNFHFAGKQREAWASLLNGAKRRNADCSVRIIIKPRARHFYEKQVL